MTVMPFSTACLSSLCINLLLRVLHISRARFA